MKKTKLSSILDNSSYGMSIGSSQMEISQKCEKQLRRMLKNSPLAHCIEGNELIGNGTFQVQIEDHFIGRYEFKQQNKNRFLNVTTNPTKLVSGENDIPVLITGCEHMYLRRTDANSVLTTFMFMNRLPYILLERIPSSRPFVWEGEERKSLQNGNINISRYQIAWYSGDLKEQRPDILNYLRLSYGGLIGSSFSTNKSVRNLASELGLTLTIHDNHDGNITLEKKYKNYNKSFSITLYCKDDNMQSSEKEKNRLSQLIRFDCTLHQAFLEGKKINKLSLLESKYEALCEEKGYDAGFLRWIREDILDTLKFNYLLNLDSENYEQMILAADDVAGKLPRLLIDKWKDFNTSFGNMTLPEIAQAIKIPLQSASNLSAAIQSVYDQTGIDIRISRAYHSNILFNRMTYHMSPDEKDNMVRKNKGNQRATPEELIERDLKKLEKLRRVLNTEGGLLIRKFKPHKINVEKLWVLQKIQEFERRKSTFE